MTERSIQEAEDALALELLAFIQEAIAQILREEDEGAFLAWVRAEAPRRLPGLFADLPNEQAARAVAFEMGWEIWNKVPLPGAGYRTRPIPRPERNALCPCGSGLKHKKCCGAVAGGRLELPLNAEDAWALVLGQTSEAEVAQLSADRRVPRGLIPGIALRLAGMGGAEVALSLLEPLFEEPGRLEERDAPAIEALIEVYDELGLDESKERAIARLNETLRPALRIVLWESLAQSFTAQGEVDRAWEAVEHVRRADPDSPVLGTVEVILLLGDHRLAEAAERAKDALQRHRRRPGLTDEALALLQETADDPAASRRRLLLDEFLPSVERFEKLLAAHAARPIRPYTIRAEEETPGAGRLIAPEDLAQVEDGWVAVLDVEEADDLDWDEEEDDDELPVWEAENEDDEEDEDEEDWEEDDDDGEVWDFDASDSGDGEEDWQDEAEEMWDPEEADGWLTFLEENPQAFDSLLVLSDLALRASSLADLRDGSLREGLVRPLVTRGVAILDASLATAPRVILPADLEENVSALEILEASASLSKEPVPEIAPLERLLELDPEDNLLARSQLGTAYLWAGEPQKTLDLAARFPEEEDPCLSLAKVIALRRLGRQEESLEVLDELLDRFPLIIAALALSSSRIPDGLLELWQNDEELWRALSERLAEDDNS
ncbi:MAG TPA: SEC-C domain-containing protein [Thermoanaerobaculia bacterium]|nr:SEC-C domain-containing protein [Thermoanaerobaculia bacterium]